MKSLAKLATTFCCLSILLSTISLTSAQIFKFECQLGTPARFTGSGAGKETCEFKGKAGDKISVDCRNCNYIYMEAPDGSATLRGSGTVTLPASGTYFITVGYDLGQVCRDDTVGCDFNGEGFDCPQICIGNSDQIYIYVDLISSASSSNSSNQSASPIIVNTTIPATAKPLVNCDQSGCVEIVATTKPINTVIPGPSRQATAAATSQSVPIMTLFANATREVEVSNSKIRNSYIFIYLVIIGVGAGLFFAIRRIRNRFN